MQAGFDTLIINLAFDVLLAYSQHFIFILGIVSHVYVDLTFVIGKINDISAPIHAHIHMD